MKNVTLILCLLISAGCSKRQEVTLDYLNKNPNELQKQYNRCKSLGTENAIKDPICQLVSRAKSDLLKNYTDKGKPVPIHTKMPRVE